MMPKHIADATNYMGAPKGWDEEKQGRCTTLSVRVVGDVYQSAWEPTPTELRALIEGGTIVLSVVGGQPPVALTVEPLE